MMWSPVTSSVDKTKFAPMLNRDTQFDRRVPNGDVTWSTFEKGEDLRPSKEGDVQRS